MKKILLASLCLFTTGNFLLGQVARDRVVAIEVSQTDNPPLIHLDWSVLTTATADSYTIFRKLPEEWNWTELKTVTGLVYSYTDSSVQKGQAYDYFVQYKQGSTFLYGFVCTGIELPPVHYRGEVFVAVDSALNQSIPEELSDYYAQLVGDGWSVHIEITGSQETHQGLRDKVRSWYNQNPGRHRTLLLFGDIPIPYSGNLNPDAHPDHKGAWPADVYYGVYDADWTDFNTHEAASRTENKNYPNDGKWDQTVLPAENKLHIGRVYLDNLSTFGLGRDSLYKRYLTKDKQYRNNNWRIPRKALVDDALNALGGEYPGRNGFQNGYALMGLDSTFFSNDTFINRLRNEQWLFSHASSTGGYTSNKQLNSAMFKTATYSVFQTSFGSYHGDWDYPNNLLRAEIAGPGYGLTSVWAGRPQWHFLHMSMGYPIGFSAWATQNNFIDNQHETFDPGYGAGWVHVTLMGDPTLRLHVFDPPSGLNAQVNSGGDQVTLSWLGNGDPQTTGYYVYRSDSLFGIWNLVNETPVTGTTLVDEHPLPGNNMYRVRAVRMEQSATGTYANLSQGTFAQATAPNGDGSITGIQEFRTELRIYPNPGRGLVRIETGLAEPVECMVFDLKGRQLMNSRISGSGQLDLSSLPPGTYLLRCGERTERIVLLP